MKLLDCLKFLWFGISCLRLGRMEREEKKLRLVQLKALNVQAECLVAAVVAALVYSNTNGTSLNWGNLGLLHTKLT